MLRKYIRTLEGGLRGDWRSFMMRTFSRNIRVIKSRIMNWLGRGAIVGEMRSSHGILVGKPDGQIPLRSPR